MRSLRPSNRGAVLLSIDFFSMQIAGSVDGRGELGLPGAAAEFFDAATLLTLGGALLASSAAFLVMRLYMRTVFRESQRSGSRSDAGEGLEETRQPLISAIRPLDIHTEKPERAAWTAAARSPTFQHADAAFNNAARVYVLGGSLHVATSVALLFLFRSLSVPSTPSRLTILACYAAVFWSWSVITVTALALFRPERRFRVVLATGYLAFVPLMGMLLAVAGGPPLPFADVGVMQESAGDLVLAYTSAVLGQPMTAEAVILSPLMQPLVFWTMTAPPLVIPFLFFNRFVRGTVGPLFISVALMLVITTFLIADLALSTSPGVWLVVHARDMVGGSTKAVLLGASLALSAVVALLGLLWIAGRYRRRRLSDQTFLFDTLWFSTSCWVSVYLASGDNQFQLRYVIGFLPFVVYKLTAGYGLRRRAAVATRLPTRQLLFLRVFGAPSRSERLFDLLAARWRYAGGIRLISATDVARGRFEPDELLEFLGGRLTSSFISSRSDLDRRLARQDLQPDPDGRHRIDEFFCRVDTWQPTVTSLMAQSDLVAMDLRGFSAQKKGCIFELGALIDAVPLERVALLIDRTTDEPLLRQTISELWRTMNPESPNASGPARLRMIDLACGYPAAVRRLMQLGDEVAQVSLAAGTS